MEEKKFLIGLGILLTLGLAGFFLSYFPGDGFNYTSADETCSSSTAAALAGKCNTDEANCEKGAASTTKCEQYYNKRLTHCYKYHQKADQVCSTSTDPSLPCYSSKCKTKYDRCEAKAQRYTDASKKSAYEQKCQTRFNDCILKAKDKRERYLTKETDCINKAGDRKSACEARVQEKNTGKIEKCQEALQGCCASSTNSQICGCYVDPNTKTCVCPGTPQLQ
jgi:hypothetical protein